MPVCKIPGVHDCTHALYLTPSVQNNIAATHGKVTDFKLSPKFTSTNQELLLTANREKVYRHSSLADYILYSNG